MELGVISVRYARALLKSATEIKIEDAVYQDMQCILRCYLEVQELRTTIDNPMLSTDKKETLMVTAAGNQPTDLTKRFIALVLKEGRASALQFMAASYITLYRKQKNIIRGRLVTATPVSSATERKMQEMVESMTHGTVEFNTEVDPDIIGGFILEYDTYRMDASVKTHLRKILAELK
ncbi:MAG: F0F1 ATP synthase subunit delta [Prevotella sp.]|nr:F0F1 ATP synthase subunit delta [Bacteroidales bacterium]MDD6745711.1 F0F1 ATP synthase subunit delta [Bacteroidales bacterium]